MTLRELVEEEACLAQCVSRLTKALHPDEGCYSEFMIGVNIRTRRCDGRHSEPEILICEDDRVDITSLVEAHNEILQVELLELRAKIKLAEDAIR